MSTRPTLAGGPGQGGRRRSPGRRGRTRLVPDSRSPRRGSTSWSPPCKRLADADPRISAGRSARWRCRRSSDRDRSSRLGDAAGRPSPVMPSRPFHLVLPSAAQPITPSRKTRYWSRFARRRKVAPRCTGAIRASPDRLPFAALKNHGRAIVATARTPAAAMTRPGEALSTVSCTARRPGSACRRADRRRRRLRRARVVIS